MGHTVWVLSRQFSSALWSDKETRGVFGSQMSGLRICGDFVLLDVKDSARIWSSSQAQ